ncbi:protein SRG1 [Cajanus cajan]|uniref:Protein SRG1 n=1 Tax=Cajanus cajan TaxID=3821 RepID=A0A151T2G9_CAJCA|nr:protein SRG1 [Cajanus cajan]KYP61262.1 Protein SRG1 [Cajanus cajan]
MEPASLTVPFVQEIAKEALTSVPERYVRPYHERPILSTTTPLPQIPVIDLSKLLSQDLKGPELEMLHCACKEWGFFQLINHGVSISLVENVKIGAQELFNLPIEEKKKFAQREGDVEGYGQLFVVNEDQKLDWADMFYMFTLPPEKRKPHLLPKFPSSFRDDLETYIGEMNKLCIQILNLMANALEVDTAEMTEGFEPGAQSMRINYYPPCPKPDLVLGLNPHSDAGVLTILLQANEVEGLQIKKDGQWIPVKPLSNAFIVNIGDILEITTNGIYRSIEHRVRVNTEKERLSIATFNLPSMESIFGPAPSLVTPEKPALFRRTSYAEYYRGFLSRELRGKSFLDGMRIN